MDYPLPSTTHHFTALITSPLSVLLQGPANVFSYPQSPLQVSSETFWLFLSTVHHV